MATGFNILFSSVLTGSGQPIELYKKLLAVVLESPNICNDTCQLAIYRGQPPFNYDAGNDPHVLVKERLSLGVTAQKLFELIDNVEI